MVLKGLLAGGLTTGIAAIFPEPLVLPLFAAVLGLLAGVYPGIALADPVDRRGGLQWVVALGTLGMALVGLWATPLLLAAAWVLHGGWALAHRFNRMGEGVPEGLPGFSLSFSLVMASVVVYMWAAGA